MSLFLGRTRDARADHTCSGCTASPPSFSCPRFLSKSPLTSGPTFFNPTSASWSLTGSREGGKLQSDQLTLSLELTSLASYRPGFHILDTLLGSTATPSPPKLPKFSPGAVAKALRARSAVTPPATDDDEPSTPTADSNGKRKDESVSAGATKPAADDRSVVNSWPALLASACDHPDAHLAKVRPTTSLFFFFFFFFD